MIKQCRIMVIPKLIIEHNMKLRVIILSCVIMLTTNINAQEKDSVNNDTEHVSITIDALSKLNNEKDLAVRDLQAMKDSINNLIIELKQIREKASNLDLQLMQIKSTNQDLLNHVNKTDTCLINMASNFLYIPYEAYSVEKIAIPAFDNIHSKALKDKRIIKYNLLCNYQNDIKELSKFLVDVQSEVKKPFTKDGKSLLLIFKEKEVYKSYIKYSDYKYTYLGKFIIQIVNNLNAFKKEAILTEFSAIDIELNNCLKTMEDLWKPEYY